MGCSGELSASCLAFLICFIFSHFFQLSIIYSHLPLSFCPLLSKHFLSYRKSVFSQIFRHLVGAVAVSELHLQSEEAVDFLRCCIFPLHSPRHVWGSAPRAILGIKWGWFEIVCKIHFPQHSFRKALFGDKQLWCTASSPLLKSQTTWPCT